MCGIAGVFTRDDLDLRLLSGAMSSSIAHRGPDGSGQMITTAGERSLLLVHSRLAIIDLSDEARQPMTDEQSGNTIVFNGEIYNFRELRAELNDESRPWATASDTEVILRAYRVWGRSCVNHLRGMFAFALWDATHRELFIARDRLGIKPLYYIETPGTFAFASEVRALLRPELSRRQVASGDVALYLRHQTVPAPRTIVSDISMLPAGTWMSLPADGASKLQRYWSARTMSAPAPRASGDALRTLLLDSIRDHLVSDVPVGCFLSGGIDSSAILALTAAAGMPLRSFTVGFDDASADESSIARATAARFGSQHTEVRVTMAEAATQVMSALSCLDHPTGDALNTYIVSRAVRSAGMKVALSGLGADELFGGYPSFRLLPRYARLRPFLRMQPHAVRRMLASLVRRAGAKTPGRSRKMAALVENAPEWPEAYAELRSIFSNEEISRLAGDVRPADPFARLLGALDGGPDAANVAYAELSTYMADVLLRDTDQMSMAHALETRVPYLDHRVVEYVLSLPDRTVRGDGPPKRLLIDALRGELPPDVVRGPKRGFALPMAAWIRGPLREFCRERIANGRLRAAGALSADAVDEVWREFELGRLPWATVWVLVVLEDWVARNGLTPA